MSESEKQNATDKKMTIRIPINLHSALDKLAERDRRSLHGEILVLLEEAVAARQGKIVSSADRMLKDM